MSAARKIEHSSANQRREDAKNRAYSCGIWLLVARMNHSCIGTAMRCFIGDVLIVRAAADLAAGDEITFSYVNQHAYINDDTRDTLNGNLRAQFGFECCCALCLDARTTPASVKRNRRALANGVKTATDAVLAAIGAVGNEMFQRGIEWIASPAGAAALAARLSACDERMVAEAERRADSLALTYASAAATAAAPKLLLGVARLNLCVAWLALARHTPPGHPEVFVRAAKAAASALDSLRAFGFEIRGGVITPPTSSGRSGRGRDSRQGQDTLVVEKWGYVGEGGCQLFERLMQAYSMVDAPQALIDTAMTHMRTAYRILIGEDEATFDKKYPQYASS